MTGSRTPDPRLHGTLVVIAQDGRTADPHLEAVAVAQGYAMRRGDGRLVLTKRGKAELR